MARRRRLLRPATAPAQDALPLAAALGEPATAGAPLSPAAGNAPVPPVPPPPAAANAPVLPAATPPAPDTAPAAPGTKVTLPAADTALAPPAAAPPAAGNPPAPAAATPSAANTAPVPPAAPPPALPDSLTVAAPALTPSVNTLVNELRAANFYSFPSSQGLPDLGAPPPARPEAHLTAYGLVVTGGLLPAGDPTHLTASGLVDGTSATFVLSDQRGPLAEGFALTLAEGLGTVVYNANIGAGDQTIPVGAQLQLWRDRLRVGGAGAWGTAGSGRFAAGGAFVEVRPTAAVTDLGPYTEADARTLAEGLAAAHVAPSDLAGGHPVAEVVRDHAGRLLAGGLRQVSVHRGRQLNANLLGGGGLITFGSLGRLSLAGGREITYRTVLPAAAARAVVFEGWGLCDYLRNRIRALDLPVVRRWGWARERLRIPDPEAWQTLRIGDRVTMTRSHSRVVDVLLGQVAVWLGGQALCRGDRELVIHRTSATELEITYAPAHQVDRSAYIFSPFGVRAEITSSRVRAVRHGVRLDMREPDAERLYRAWLAASGGGLRPRPAVPAAVTAAAAAADAATASDDGAPATGDVPAPLGDGHDPAKVASAAAAAAAAAEVPSGRGIDHLFTHVLADGARHLGGGLHLALLPNAWLPKGWVNALLARRRASREAQAATDGHHVAATTAAACEHHVARGPAGSALTRAATTAYAGAGGVPTAVTLELRLVRGNADGRATQRHLVAPLAAFRGRTPRPSRAGVPRARREVEVVQVLTPADVAALGRLGDGRRLPTMARQQSRAQGVPPTALTHLGRAIAAAGGPGEGAAAIQDFVGTRGLAGLGALRAALPPEAAAPAVSYRCSTYEDAETAVARATFRYPGRVSAAAGSRGLVARLGEVRRAALATRTARTALAGDPLVEPGQIHTLDDSLAAHYPALRERCRAHEPEAPRVAALAGQLSFWQRRRTGGLEYLLEPPDAVDQLAAAAADAGGKPLFGALARRRARRALAARGAFLAAPEAVLIDPTERRARDVALTRARATLRAR